MVKRICFLVFLCIAQAGSAADYYVMPNGSDANPGTMVKPFKTLAQARDSLRQSGKLGKEPITIHVGAGTHYLEKTLVLNAEDSGTKEAPVVWRAAKDKEVRLVGGRPLDLKWESHTAKIFKASVLAGTKIDQLFMNGKRQILARYPNYNPEDRYYCGAAPTAERMKGWKKPELVYIHALHAARWGSGHIVLKRDKEGRLYEYMVAIDTTTQGNGATLNHELRFAENVFEELDASREWFFDGETGTLHYQPENKSDLDNALFEAVANPHLVRLKGTSSAPARFITLDGFIFSGAAPTWRLTQDHLPNGGDFVVKFYNGRGTAEQWIKEGKNAVKWTRLSCHDFVDNQVRLQLFALAYNLGNFFRRLALPRSVKHWSLTTLREKLVKIGAKVVAHARYVIFQMAEVAVSRQLFRAILERIRRLRLPEMVPG